MKILRYTADSHTYQTIHQPQPAAEGVIQVLLANDTDETGVMIDGSGIEIEQPTATENQAARQLAAIRHIEAKADAYFSSLYPEQVQKRLIAYGTAIALNLIEPGDLAPRIETAFYNLATLDQAAAAAIALAITDPDSAAFFDPSAPPA